MAPTAHTARGLSHKDHTLVTALRRTDCQRDDGGQQRHLEGVRRAVDRPAVGPGFAAAGEPRSMAALFGPFQVHHRLSSRSFGNPTMTPSIEDRLGISDLFTRYTCALDDGEVDTIVDCFTEDGRLVSPAVGAHKGRAAIRAFAERFARFRANGSQLRHVISNLRMHVDGDRAQATCYLIVFLTRDGKSRLLAPGRYECELHRTGGIWRFESRIVRHDHDYTLEGL